MAILYRHIRLDKNEPFYIGIGIDMKRAYEKYKSRNSFWKSIINKTDYRVDILFDDLTWEEACEKEKEFIKLYGRRDLGTGTLINLTDGGDGAGGFIHTEAQNAAKALRSQKKIKPYFCKSSGFKDKSWRVAFSRNGERINLGWFSSEAEANKAIFDYETNGTKPEKTFGYCNRKELKPYFCGVNLKKPWRVFFERLGKTINLGHFHTQEQAQEAIDIWKKNNNI